MQQSKCQIVACLIGLIIFMPQSAGAACRLALLFGLDVSASVDSREYRQQMGGLASALQDAEVRRLLLGSPGYHVAVSVYEWSSQVDQRVIVDWTEITQASDLSVVAERLQVEKHSSVARPTGIGAALEFAQFQFILAPPCTRHVLDISGDGKNNHGAKPERARDALAASGVTINALVIGQDHIAELTAYFHQRVIAGPDAFVETALGHEAYTAAMTRKLKRELQLNVAHNTSGKTPRTVARTDTCAYICREQISQDVNSGQITQY